MRGAVPVISAMGAPSLHAVLNAALSGVRPSAASGFSRCQNRLFPSARRRPVHRLHRFQQRDSLPQFAAIRGEREFDALAWLSHLLGLLIAAMRLSEISVSRPITPCTHCTAADSI